MDADFKAAMEALNRDDIQTYEKFLRGWAHEAISKHGGIYAEDGTPMVCKAIWNGYGWRTESLRRVRIRKGVKPYGGRLVDVVREDEKHLTVIPPHPAQPIERIYKRSEIEEEKP